MNIYTLAKIAVLVFTVALCGRNTLSEPDTASPAARKQGADTSPFLLAEENRCQSCKRVLGMEAPESFLSKDPDFKQNVMFQTCQGCLDGKMNAQTQAAYVKVAMKYKWNSIAHNAHMDEKFNKKEKAKLASVRKEELSRGLLLVARTSFKSGITTNRHLTAYDTSTPP